MARRDESGFSLLELLLVTLLLLVISGGVFSALVTNQKTFDAEQANAEANANARFAMNRIKEILESSGNNPAQVSNINDQTGGIVSLYETLNSTPYNPMSGVQGTTVALTPGTTNCGTGQPVNNFCGVAVELLSDLNGDGTTDDVINSSIFNQNIITSERVQLYHDLMTSQVYLVDKNSTDVSGNLSRATIAEFITDLRFRLLIPTSSIAITITARSNRAISIESRFERRFRYATLTSVVRIRNMNNNVAALFAPYKSELFG